MSQDKSKEIINTQNKHREGKRLKKDFKKIESQCKKKYHISNQCFPRNEECFPRVKKRQS